MVTNKGNQMTTVYAVYEFIQYESNDMVKLFSTMEKAEAYAAEMNSDIEYADYAKYTAKAVVVE